MARTKNIRAVIITSWLLGAAIPCLNLQASIGDIFNIGPSPHDLFSLTQGPLLRYLLNDDIPTIPCEGCLAGTLIKTDQGDCPVEYLDIGDTVISFDFTTESCTQGKITSIQTIHPIQHIVSLRLQSTTINLGLDHLVYSLTDNSWIAAQSVCCGTSILNCSGAPIIVDKVDFISGLDVTLYDITVQDHHNFFISEQGIMVHNMLPVAAAAASGAYVSIGWVFGAGLTWGFGITGGLGLLLFLYEQFSGYQAKIDRSNLEDNFIYAKKNERSSLGNEKSKTFKKRQQHNVPPPNNNKNNDVIAKKLGYPYREKNPPFDSQGMRVYSNGKNEFISRDRTFHNGGFWKKYKGNKRLGTYNENLSQLIDT